MVNKQLTVNLSSGISANRQFLTVEQVPFETEVVDAETAAEFVDELYNTSICEGFDIPQCGQTYGGGGDKGEEPTDDDINKAVENLEIPSCDYLDGYNAGIKIYLSDRTQDYRLILNDAKKVGSTVLEYEIKTLMIKVTNSNREELKYPILGSLVAKWVGSVFTDNGVTSPPDIGVSGNDLVWSRSVTGLLKVTFATEYDLVNVFVKTQENESNLSGASLLVFFLLAVQELDIVPPVLDGNISIDELRIICDDPLPTIIGGGVNPSDDCYSAVLEQKKCVCSGNIVDSNTIRSQAACPSGQKTGQVGPTRKSVNYVDCDETGQVNDPAYYEEVCCVPAPSGLPECKTKRSSYSGDGMNREDYARLRKAYGADAIFIAVSPDQGICGELRVNQLTGQKNCCEDVEPLSPFPENPTSISPGMFAYLLVLGGDLSSVEDWEWKCSGGLSFSNGANSITGGDKQVVRAEQELCSNNTVTVDDGCSTVTMSLSASVNTPFFIPVEVRQADADSMISITALGGVMPIEWSGSSSLTLIASAGRTALFKTSKNFCGAEDVFASDACGVSASGIVQSTQGHWENVFVDACTCSAAGAGEIVSYNGGFPSYGIKADGRYWCGIRLSMFGVWALLCRDTAPCGAEEFITGMNAEFCDAFSSVGIDASDGGACCTYTSDKTYYLERGQYVHAARKWECP